MPAERVKPGRTRTDAARLVLALAKGPLSPGMLRRHVFTGVAKKDLIYHIGMTVKTARFAGFDVYYCPNTRKYHLIVPRYRHDGIQKEARPNP